MIVCWGTRGVVVWVMKYVGDLFVPCVEEVCISWAFLESVVSGEGGVHATVGACGCSVARVILWAGHI